MNTHFKGKVLGPIKGLLLVIKVTTVCIYMLVKVVENDFPKLGQIYSRNYYNECHAINFLISE